MPAERRREERPKFSLKEDLDYRINGLEQTKLEPNMTVADKAALDRAIEKLKRQKAEKLAAKAAKKDEDEV